jgi:2-methylisocitrate lyase-like PEP mutase family enzyme
MTTKRKTWSELIRAEGILPLPAAHDALTARLIERAGFKAFQIGGFALEASLFALPDADLTHLGEKSLAVSRILRSTELPCLVDADDGYGDAKNVVHTIETYERLGAAALFLEDQKPPKECGHMAGKAVVPREAMVRKIRAASEARNDKEALFLLARTDAREPEGLDAALSRAEHYLRAGADGIYVEGPKSEGELRKIGDTFEGVPLATSILERGGVTPWTDVGKMRELGFSMVLYPTSLLFRLTKAVEDGLEALKTNEPCSADNAVDMKHFEKVVDIDRWFTIQKKYHGGPDWDEE